MLLRDIERVPLSAKSFDTLCALVSRSGQTLTKTELLQIVWGGTVVEENSLNKCVWELRKALGERRGQHHYIVTITGVGFRFVAPVIPGQSPTETSVDELPRNPAAGSRFPRLRIALASGSLLLIAGTLWINHFRAAAPERTAVILPFKSLSAASDDVWLSAAIGEMLFDELAGTPPAPGKLRLIPAEDIAQMARDLPGGRLQDIRTYTRADLALSGTVTTLAGQAEKSLRIGLRIQDLRSGEVIATASVDGFENQTFSMVRSLAERVGQMLGTSPPIAHHRPGIPASARAMQPYAEGLAALRSGELVAARDRLLQAVEADPSNALSHSALAAAWSGLGYERNAADSARRAFDLAASLDDLDRLAIEGRYRLITRDWARAAEIYEAIWRLVPESIENAATLVEAYQSSGRIQDARRVIARLRTLPAPRGDNPQIDLLEAKLAAATWSDHRRTIVLARRAAEKAAKCRMRDVYARARLWQARAMWSAGEPGSAQLRAEALAVCRQLGDSGCVAWALRGDGNAFLVAGRMRDARMSYDQALSAARQAGNLGEQINDLNGLGLLHCGMGDFVSAGGYFREALQFAREIRSGPAMIHNNYAHVLTEAGSLSEAREQALAALQDARAAHEVESEADSLAALAVLDRIGGNPHHAISLARSALAVARQSGKKLAEIEIELDLALALAATGQAGAAQDTWRHVDSARTDSDGLGSGYTRAAIAFDAGNFTGTEPVARSVAQEAAAAGAGYYQTRAEALLALTLLAQGRTEEARAAAARAMAIPQTPEGSLSRLEARFVSLAAARELGDLTGLEEEARQAGYIELALEIQLAAAGQASRTGQADAARLLRQVESDAAAKGYAAIAGRARAIQPGGIAPRADASYGMFSNARCRSKSRARTSQRSMDQSRRAAERNLRRLVMWAGLGWNHIAKYANSGRGIPLCWTDL